MEGPVAVVGCGALGGLVAASLLRARKPVLLVGRDRARLRRIRRHGIKVVGAEGTWRARGDIRVDTGRGARGCCQLVFLCLKAYQVRAALPAVHRLAARGASVVSLANGLSHERLLERAFGSRRTVIGAAYLAAMRTGPAEVRHAGGDCVRLARTSSNRAAAEAAARALRLCGWRVGYACDPARLLWTKAALNAAANPIGALTLKTNDQLAADPALRDLLIRTARETVAVARAAGHPPLVPGLAARVVAACAAAPGQLNSMAQDLAAGRRTEAGEILAPILAAARRSRTPAPLLSGLYRFVRGLEGALHAR